MESEGLTTEIWSISPTSIVGKLPITCEDRNEASLKNAWPEHLTKFSGSHSTCRIENERTGVNLAWVTPLLVYLCDKIFLLPRSSRYSRTNFVTGVREERSGGSGKKKTCFFILPWSSAHRLWFTLEWLRNVISGTLSKSGFFSRLKLFSLIVWVEFRSIRFS